MDKTFKETIQAMTGKEIVMTMVNGLRNEHAKVRMISYGHKIFGVCYGCAATNTIAELFGGDTSFVLNNSKCDTFERCSNVDKDWKFVSKFERAIDFLRMGYICDYNFIAREISISELEIPNRELPALTDAGYMEKLYAYEGYANSL